MENNIELELRAEISLSQFEELLAELNKKNKLLSHKRRLSVMFLGKINQSNFDIRARIDSDGISELVVKKGDFHAHDRIESTQGISKDQFVGIVRTFSMFGFESKVTERENFTFDLGSDITLVMVKANTIAYVEIEKMSHHGDVEKNKEELLSVIEKLELKLIKDDKEFNELCGRLTKYSDWVFDGEVEHVEKLTTMLLSY